MSIYICYYIYISIICVYIYIRVCNVGVGRIWKFQTKKREYLWEHPILYLLQDEYIYVCTPVRLGSSFLKSPSSAPLAAPEWSLDHGAKSALLALPQDMQQVPGEFPPWSGLEGKLASREFNSLLLKMAHLKLNHPVNMVIFRSYVSLPEGSIQGNLPAMNITGFFPLDQKKQI